MREPVSFLSLWQRRPPARHLGVVLGVWVVVVAAAMALATQLDRPAGESTPDAAQPLAGDVALTTETPERQEGQLPPLAVVLDLALPAEVTGLAPEEQLRRLRAEAGLTSDPRGLLLLGMVSQRYGAYPAAEAAFRDTLTVDPGNLAAQVGLAVNAGAAGEEELARAGEALGELADAHPQSQVVAVNRGWVAVYEGDPAVAEAAWGRAVALDGDSRLGALAASLRRASAAPGAVPEPSVPAP